MSLNFDEMIDDLKKEISDNLTRRISFVPIEPAKQNHLNFKKKKDKQKFLVSLALSLISFFVIVSILLIIIFNNKTLFKYKVYNNVTSNVILNDKDFSKENESTNSYLANLIDKINFKFTNKIDYNGKYNSKKNITVSLEIIDANDENNIVFKKTDILLKDSISIFNGNQLLETSNFIDYKKYNDLASKYAMKIKIPFVTRLAINYTNIITSENGVKESIKQMIYIPLLVDSVNITYDFNEISNGRVTKDFKISNFILVLSILFLILFILSTTYLVILFKRNKNNLTVLEKKYKKIMDNYNSIIMEVENNNFDNKLITIDVKYFVDLIDAQQELHIPILCYTDKVTGRTWFYIVTDKLMYKYELNKTEELI